MCPQAPCFTLFQIDAHLPCFKVNKHRPRFSLLQFVSSFPTLGVGVIVGTFPEGAFEGSRLEVLKMPKLTTKSVQALKKPGRYGDGDGLYLEVSRTGSKSWILRVTVHGRRRDIGLGGISWVSLAEARDKARELRKVAKEGRDPLAERQAQKDIPTFEEIARMAYEHLKPGWRKGGVHVKHWISSLELHVFPMIGDRPINTIKSGDVLNVLQPIWFKIPETARRVRQRMRHVMQWAKGTNLYTGENPVDAAKGSLPRHSNETKKHFPALPYAEMPAFMESLADRQGVAALALRFTILTAARSSEVRYAQWSEVDLENAVWTVPGTRMKAKKDHRVPLTAEVLAVLEQVRGLDRDLVFPGRKRGKPMADTTLLAIVRRMGQSYIVVHGFRSTFRDWAAERTTFPREISEICLSHEVGSAVERAYRRSDLIDRRRELMERWARFCVSTGADVIEIGGRG